MLDAIRARVVAGPKDTYKELDDAMRPDVWRIVEQRARLAQMEPGASSARPTYVATVYNIAHAVFYACAPNDMLVLLREIDRLREVLDKTGEQVQVLQAMLAGKTTQEEVDFAYEHACDVGDEIWEGLKNG